MARVVQYGMSAGDPQPTATVLALDGRLAAYDPWQLLASGDGMLVSWRDGVPAVGHAWGAPLRSTSVLARQLHEITARAGGPPTSPRRGRLYRLELPAGFGVEESMGAVGGGLRAAVRDPGSNRIAGQARLVPLASRAGPLAFSGPALGLMALTIAAEMAGGELIGSRMSTTIASTRSVARRGQQRILRRTHQAMSWVLARSSRRSRSSSTPADARWKTSTHNQPAEQPL